MHHRFAALDSLRGAAAFMVVLYHVSRLFTDRDTLVPHGYLAVDFFFILSGFVIDHAYGARLAAKRVRLQAFLRGRLVRLGPLSLLGTLTGFAFCAAHGWAVNGSVVTPWVAGWAAALTAAFVPNRLNGAAYPMNPPTWSLTFELLANVSFACLAPVLTRTRLLILVGASGALLAVGTLLLGSVGLNMSRWPMLALALPRVAFGFFAGVLLQRTRSDHPIFGWRALAVSTTILLAVLSLPSSSPLVDLLAVLVVLPLVVAVTSRVRVGRRGTAVCTVLGELSFPVYALHMPLMAWVLDAGRLSGLPLGAPSSGLLAVSVMVAVASAVGRYIDQPVRMALTAALSGQAPARIGREVEVT